MPELKPILPIVALVVLSLLIGGVVVGFLQVGFALQDLRHGIERLEAMQEYRAAE